MAELPKAWVVTAISEFAVTQSGGTPSTTKPEYWQSGDVPWINSGELKDRPISKPTTYITKLALANSSAKVFPANTVVIALTGATTGKVGLLEFACSTNQSVTGIFPSAAFIPEYLYYYLRAVRNIVLARSLGSAQPHINKRIVDEFQVPLAPINEQRRIVDMLKHLVAAVERCQNRIERVGLILQRFRRSVLAAACSGRLTEVWREAQKELPSAESLLTPEIGEESEKRKRAGRLWGAGVVPVLTEDEREGIPSHWIWAKVRQLGRNPEDTVQVGPMSMASRDFSELGVPVLNVGCVQWGRFDESKLDHMPHEKARQFERYRIQKDDILFTRSGTIGRCAIALEKQNGHLMTFHLLRVRPNAKKCLPQYLQFVFQGAKHIRRQTEGAAIGSTRAGFNTNLLAGIDVPLPPLIEQQEIVRSVGALFKFADQIESRYNAAKASVDQLTQSILAKAFRGELVPQDPKDESASTLLARISESHSLKHESRRKEVIRA